VFIIVVSVYYNKDLRGLLRENHMYKRIITSNRQGPEGTLCGVYILLFNNAKVRDIAKICISPQILGDWGNLYLRYLSHSTNFAFDMQKSVLEFANIKYNLYLCTQMIVTFEETYQNCQTIINKEEQNMITLKGKDPKMIANNLKPFKPTHPGEVLKDELEFRGISQRGLAKKMDISYSALNEVLNGKRALNPELAMMMEAALGVDAAPLLAMQNEYDMQMAERNETFMEKLKHLRRIAAIF
jgi:addiction module HigA family antidote